MYSIGIDIGATKINFVLLKNLKIVKKKKVSTPKNKKELIKVLIGTVNNLILKLPKSQILGIGIGVAGPINKNKDLILNPPNLTCLRNCFLAGLVEKELKIKTFMDNDANCFALGEAILGAGKSTETVFGITLGSGVGGGIIQKLKVKSEKLKVKIYSGAFGSAGEVGHMCIKFDGFRCSCGNKGCLEEYASERFIKRKTKISPLELEKKAKRGDRNAQEIYRQLGKNLGVGLANIVNILDPEVIVIGGGISKAGEFILKSAKKEMQKRIISPVSKKYVKIKKAGLGDYAGAIGAALLQIIDNNR